MELHLHETDIEAIAQRVATLLDQEHEARSEDGWMTTAEAAAHLGVSLRTLRTLIARRAIPYSQERPGAHQFFRTSDLDRWRAEQAHEPDH